MSSKKPIGVFDSGIGGLTVLEELVKIFPNEDFIYVADQGHCPYGVKTPEQIFGCVKNVVEYLLTRDVKAIVIACNTASLFVEQARKLTNIPIISVIEPTCAYALNTTKNHKIAVLATIATINKGRYQELIKNAGGEAFGVPCQDFVSFVENNDIDDPKGEELVRNSISCLKDKGVDTLIHGCTHFSLLEPQMRKVLGDINYVACGYPTSLELKRILEEKDELNDEAHDRYVKIYTTGSIEQATSSMKWFKAPHEEIVKIDVDK